MNIRKNSEILEASLTSNGVLRLNLNSPENLNALSENMIDLMQKNIDKGGSNKNVRVIIISSEGTTFSSGHDLKEVTGDNQNHGTYDWVPDMFTTLTPQPRYMDKALPLGD